MFNPEQLKTFINNLPGWVVLLDDQGECFLFNESFADSLVTFPRTGKGSHSSVPFWLQGLQVQDRTGVELQVWPLIEDALKRKATLKREVLIELLDGTQAAVLQMTPLPGPQARDLMGLVHFQFEKVHAAELQIKNQELEQELGLLKRLQVMLAHDVNLEGVFNTVVNATFEMMDHARVYVAFAEGDILKTGPARGVQLPETLSMQDSLAGHVLRMNRPLHLQDARRPQSDLPLPPNVTSVLGVPFGRPHTPHGVILVESEKEVLTTRDLQVLQTVVNHLNIALDTISLHRKVSEDLRRFSALYGVSQAIHQQRSRQSLLEDIAQKVQEALLVRWSLIFTLTPNGQAIACAAGAAREAPELSLELDMQELQSGLSGWVMRERKPALSSKHVLDPRESPQVQERRRSQNIGAVIVAPLLDPESPRVLGTLTILNGLYDRDFTEEDMQLVMAVARQVSVSLSQRDLLDRVQRLGTV